MSRTIKAAIREKVVSRSAYCMWCSKVLTADVAVHHRKLKSRGGTDDLSNLVALHHACHNLGTHAVHNNVRDATRRGFIVASWDTPNEVPLVLVNGDIVKLTDEDG